MATKPNPKAKKMRGVEIALLSGLGLFQHRAVGIRRVARPERLNALSAGFFL